MRLCRPAAARMHLHAARGLASADDQGGRRWPPAHAPWPAAAPSASAAATSAPHNGGYPQRPAWSRVSDRWARSKRDDDDTDTDADATAATTATAGADAAVSSLRIPKTRRRYNHSPPESPAAFEDERKFERWEKDPTRYEKLPRKKFQYVRPGLLYLPRSQEKNIILSSNLEDWSTALGVFIGHYLPTHGLGKMWLPMPSATFSGVEYARSIGLAAGTKHFTDFVNEAVVIKIKDDLLQPGLGWIQDGVQPETYTLKRAITVDFQYRSLVFVQKTTNMASDMETMSNVHANDRSGVLVAEYPVPKVWLDVFKGLDWPEPWNDPEVLMHSGRSCIERMYEDVILDAYQRTVEVGSHRF